MTTVKNGSTLKRDEFGGGGSIAYLAAPSGDTTGATDTAALQALITAAADETTIVLPGIGTYWFDTVSIDGKNGLTILAPAAVLKRIASPTNHLFVIGQTTACNRLTFDLAEIDGNNFAGNANTGDAFRSFGGGTGLKIRAYIHHTWDHAIHLGNNPHTSVDIDVRAENIGVGYNADNTFNANFPMGCVVNIGTTGAVTDGIITLRNSHDIKGAAAVYVGACTGLEVHFRRVRRTGYRALFCTGTGTVTGLRVIDPDIEDCGAVYEIAPAASGGHNSGDSLYGQGTNALFFGTAPVTAEDAKVTGGAINKTGENAVEGICTVVGLLAKNTGYAYTGFGTGIAREGIAPYLGSYVGGGTRCVNPGDYGIHGFASSAALTDITIDGVEVEGAAITEIYMQQQGAFTASRVITRNVVVKQGTGSPSYGVRYVGQSGGSFDATCLIEHVVPTGTFSTATIQTDVSGGGTNTTIVRDAAPFTAKAQAVTASGTVTVPAGVTLAKITCVGAGGGGGGGGSALSSGGVATQVGGGGGGAGVAVAQLATVAPGQTLTVTIGAAGTAGGGGAANSNAGSSGGTGGDTTVTGSSPTVAVTGKGGHGGAGGGANSTSSAGGGTQGPNSTSTSASQVGQGGAASSAAGAVGGAPSAMAGGGGSGGSNATASLGGSAGSPGTLAAGGAFVSGQGGTASGVAASDAATTSYGAGGGGGGGGAPTGAGGAGGKGGPGLCVIEWIG